MEKPFSEKVMIGYEEAPLSHLASSKKIFIVVHGTQTGSFAAVFPFSGEYTSLSEADRLSQCIDVVRKENPCLLAAKSVRDVHPGCGEILFNPKVKDDGTTVGECWLKWTPEQFASLVVASGFADGDILDIELVSCGAGGKSMYKIR